MKNASGWLVFGLLIFLAPIALADVVINEIMYNTPGTPDVEWIELYNNGSTMVELDDWYIIDDNPLHLHCNLLGDLLPGEYLVVVGDFSLFNPEYPGVTNTNINAFDPSGAGFSLGNGGDTIFMYNDDGFLVDTVAYQDGGDWPGSPDGNGPSLELVNPGLDNSHFTSWDPSLSAGGTPGQLNSTFQGNQAPIIHDTDREPSLPQAGDSVLITALVSDASDLNQVRLHVDLGSGYVSQFMFDDGAHGDGAPADSLFGVTIPSQPEGTLVRYYVSATDHFGQTVTKPSDAPASFRAYTVGYTPSIKIRVNEIMANNTSTLADEFGEYDDWVEIWNSAFEPADLTGLYLTDSSNKHRKWLLPNVTLGGDEYMIIWCDDQPEQGPLHATFKLAGTGEEIEIYDTEEHGNTLLAGFGFGLQNPDMGFGIKDDYTGLPGKSVSDVSVYPEYLSVPTPGQVNEIPGSSVEISEFMTTSAGGGVDDWVEFANRTVNPIDISGWGVSDNPGNPLRWVFPVGTILPGHGYLVVNELELGFSFSSQGEEIQLTSADGMTGIDYIRFGQQQPDISYGRTYFSIWGFFDPPTPGDTNPSMSNSVDDQLVPSILTVDGAYPNPFNPSTNIHFVLPNAGLVRVDVYSLDGRLVRTIEGGVMGAGPASLAFNGRDNQGRKLASGVFFAKVKAGGEAGVVKMMLVK